MENNKSKVFVAGEHCRYYGELPPHLAKKGLTKDVARIILFHMVERNSLPLHSKAA